ncbi:MAG TPA: GNAT family N-acetyltransferase [Ktedonobacteraceae bacterium]|nr:GNAT family N-acetyltransferase [Ktedonobacteraceae bacterium]
MAQLEIRRAREDDREAVLAFSSQTWEWGDYIAYVWDDWLHDPRCALFAATLDEQPVGIANLRMLNATEAWLEGMRVDPAHRQHGVASALFEAQITEALRRNALTVRLITESNNTAAIRLIERSFMRRVNAFAPFKATAVVTQTKRQYSPESPTLATPADTNEIIDYLNVSNIFPAAGGLYNAGFTAYSITAALIEQKIAAQQLYLLRRWNRLDGLAMVEIRERRGEKLLAIGYIDGTTESISLLAYALRGMLPDFGLQSVQAPIPDLMMVRDAFTGAEYESDGMVFYTYERGLV